MYPTVHFQGEHSEHRGSSHLDVVLDRRETTARVVSAFEKTRKSATEPDLRLRHHVLE
jgi:hypothetical protein